MNNDSQLDFLLKKMAAEHQSELPGSGLIWWRAQILKRQEQKERIERPLIFMKLLAAMACLVVFLALIVSNRGQIQAQLGPDHWWLMPLGMLMMAAFVIAALTFLLSPSRS